MTTTEPKIQLTGAVQLIVLRNNIITDRYESNNLILTVGKDALAKLLGGNRSQTITKIGFGTNGTPAVAGDTALTGTFSKVLSAKRYKDYTGTWYGNAITVTSGQLRCEWFLDNTEANGMSIREFGLLFSDDVLFARYLRPAGGSPDVILKESDMTLAGSWTINIGT